MSAVATAEDRVKNTLEVFRRSERDRDALESMYAEVFGPEAAERNRARFRWQYEENPHCPPEGPEIWVAREDGVVLGQYATMPVRLLVKGRILRGSWGMDVMVRPNLQRKGIGSRLFLYWDQQSRLLSGSASRLSRTRSSGSSSGRTSARSLAIRRSSTLERFWSGASRASSRLSSGRPRRRVSPVDGAQHPNRAHHEMAGARPSCELPLLLHCAGGRPFYLEK